MAAPVWASSSKGGGSTTPLAITAPTGIAVGNLLSAWLHSDVSTTAATFTATGWTPTFTAITANPGAAGNTAQHFWKIADSADAAAGTFSFARSGGSGQWGAIIDRITGADTTTPIDIFATATFNSANEGTCPSITTTGADRLVFHYTTWDEGKTFVAAPAGDTVSQTNLLSSNAGGSAYFTDATAGATGTGQWDISSGTRTSNATIAFQEPTATGITGSMSVTETGSDTLAASGSVTISGSLAATEAGSDTLAASGSVLVSGSMAATETGQDVFAGTGTVAPPGAVTGSMDAVESGSDTFAGSGSTVVSLGQSSAGGGGVYHTFVPKGKEREVDRIVQLLFPKRKNKPKKARVVETAKYVAAKLDISEQSAVQDMVETALYDVEAFDNALRTQAEQRALQRQIAEGLWRQAEEMQEEEDIELLLLTA